jgi:SpoVK/Ycf46/Vps4 family AAA+-type ATPase
MTHVAQGDLLDELLPDTAAEPATERRMPRRRGVPSLRSSNQPDHRLRPLPQARNESDLLDIRDAQLTFGQLVLPKAFLEAFAEIHLEHRQEDRLIAHGVAPRRTLLFIGPPGTGKSASAEALADEMGRDFATVNLATVVSSFLGDTAKNLAAIFAAAAEQPLVLLFDEFDSIGKERAEATDHGELKRVVTAFLQLLERFQGPSILVAATNHPGLLDLATWRRFDVVLQFEPPKVHEIRALLRRKLQALPRERGLDIDALASACRGFSQADVTRVVTDAYRRHLLYRSDSEPLSTDELLTAAETIRARPTVAMRA